MPDARSIDALVAEIGSTTTVVSAFDGLSDYPATRPELLGQGVAATSVDAGDVTVGVYAARAALEEQIGPLAPRLTLATSSAAGGLRMTVHGLTQRMTAMAAREAALGAGAVVTYQTAGLLRERDLRQIEAAQPSLILLAGGVEGGDCETVLANARRLGELSLRPVVVYDAFEEHIIHAPGMERIGEVVNSRILPTPGAVLLAAERLAIDLGDLVVVDVGGATTDVHSITDGSPEFAAIQTEPQAHSRRTVEGDLGTFVSASHVAAMMPAAERPAELPPALPT